MKYINYKDLLKSPLAKSNAEVEEVLLELALVGGDKMRARDLCKILSLLNDNYHEMVDNFDATFDGPFLPRLRQVAWPTLIPASSVVVSPMQKPMPLQKPPPFLTVDDLPNLEYPSDIILKNVFKILFTTSAWDDMIFSKIVEDHVGRLYQRASSSMVKHSRVKDEEWRRFPDRKAEKLFEIWGEMLYKIAEKRKKLNSTSNTKNRRKD